MATTCPYCNTDVKESLIEAEDGCCPECGALIGAHNSFFDDDDIFSDDDIGDEFDEDFDDEEDLM